MDALLFALTLEVVLLQMKILEGCSDIRLCNWRPANKIEKLQYIKLVKDRELLRDVIRKTLVELVEDGAWNTINKTIYTLKEKERNADTLKLTNEQLKRTLAEILLERETKRNQSALELRNADQKVALLRDKMSDDTVNANTRLCYAEKWLFARFESLELRHDVPRPPKPRKDHEERVHTELLATYDLQIKEYEENLEYWQQRHKADTSLITDKIQAKSEALRSFIEKRVELQRLYALHEGEMRGWLTFKRERAARLAREEHQRMSAVRIQAWWRGVMVRRALGQFKYLRIKKHSAKGKKK